MEAKLILRNKPIDYSRLTRIGKLIDKWSHLTPMNLDLSTIGLSVIDNDLLTHPLEIYSQKTLGPNPYDFLYSSSNYIYIKSKDDYLINRELVGRIFNELENSPVDIKIYDSRIRKSSVVDIGYIRTNCSYVISNDIKRGLSYNDSKLISWIFGSSDTDIYYKFDNSNNKYYLSLYRLGGMLKIKTNLSEDNYNTNKDTFERSVRSSKSYLIKELINQLRLDYKIED